MKENMKQQPKLHLSTVKELALDLTSINVKLRSSCLSSNHHPIHSSDFLNLHYLLRDMPQSLQSDPSKEWQYSLPGEAEEDEEPSSILLPVGLLILGINAAVSVYRTRDDPWDLAFAVFSYAALLALLLCIRALERRRAVAEQADGLKAAAWALSATLNVSFAWRVAAMMPPVLAAAAWALVAIFSLASFYALILYRPVDADSSTEDGKVEEEVGVCSYKKKLSPVEEV